MFWLGLILPICYVPGIIGSTIPSQWVVLSAVLPLTLWRAGTTPALYWLWGIFIAYAMLSLSWTISINDSIRAIWIISIWALSFRLGSISESLQPMWKGLAIGMSVSSAVAIAQALGYRPVESMEGEPAGLLYNTTVSGAAAALILVALLERRLWLYIPGVLPSLILSHSRGAWLALGLVLIMRRIHWAVGVALLLGAGVILYLLQGKSDVMRMQVWQVAWANLSWFGVGPGTFGNLWFQFNGNIERPGFAHNDYLQLWFEYGIGSLPVLLVVLVLLLRIRSPEWPVFAACAVLSLFYFPLYCPLVAFMGWVAAGRIARNWYLVRGDDRGGGLYDAPRRADPGQAADLQGLQAVPVESA